MTTGTTFDCNYRQFCDQVLEFRKAMTTKGTTDEELSSAHKCLTLHYLGMSEPEKIETAAMILQSTTHEALRRGFSMNCEVLGEA